MQPADYGVGARDRAAHQARVRCGGERLLGSAWEAGLCACRSGKPAPHLTRAHAAGHASGWAPAALWLHALCRLLSVPTAPLPRRSPPRPERSCRCSRRGGSRCFLARSSSTCTASSRSWRTACTSRKHSRWVTLDSSTCRCVHVCRAAVPWDGSGAAGIILLLSVLTAAPNLQLAASCCPMPTAVLGPPRHRPAVLRRSWGCAMRGSVRPFSGACSSPSSSGPSRPSSPPASASTQLCSTPACSWCSLVSEGCTAAHLCDWGPWPRALGALSAAAAVWATLLLCILPGCCNDRRVLCHEPVLIQHPACTHTPPRHCPAPTPQPARSCASSPSQPRSCRRPTTTAAWARTRRCGRCRSTGGAMWSWMSADRCAQHKATCSLCFTAGYGGCRPALNGASSWHAVGQLMQRQSSFLHVPLAAPSPCAGHPRLRRPHLLLAHHFCADGGADLHRIWRDTDHQGVARLARLAPSSLLGGGNVEWLETRLGPCGGRGAAKPAQRKASPHAILHAFATRCNLCAVLCCTCTLCSAGHHLDRSVDHGSVHHCQPQGERGMSRHGRGMGTEVSSAGGASRGPSADSAVAHVWLTGRYCCHLSPACSTTLWMWWLHSTQSHWSSTPCTAAGPPSGLCRRPGEANWPSAVLLLLASVLQCLLCTLHATQQHNCTGMQAAACVPGTPACH